MTFIPYLPNDEIPDRSIQEWSEAYKELCALLRAKVPALKHIDLYYGQETMVDGDGNWLPFRAPAAFLEFQSVAVDELGERKQLITMNVVVRVAHETVQDTHDRSAGQRRAFEFVGLLRGIHQALHGAQGDHFGPMSRVGIGRLEAPPYWHFYQQTYRCTILDGSASPEYALREPLLPLETQPHGGPEPPWDGLVVVRNSDGTYSVDLAPGTQEHVLPNVQHTDSDGSTVELPAMAPFVAQLCDQPPPPPNELHEFAASGTYTRPASERYIGSWVALAGGGGSGGAGQVPSSGGGGGGGAGQGGARVLRWVPAADMPATVVVSVGAGGAPPANTAGLSGGTTSFGALFSAIGGAGGASGLSTNPGGAAPAGPAQLPGMPGGTGTWPASTDGTGGGGWCCPGGGGGMGMRAGVLGTAGQGGGVAGVPGGAAGTNGPGGHGTATTAEMLPGLAPTTLHIGTAGGGGGTGPDGTGQAGGDGGPGAGGGGGGCHRAEFPAGPGGAGGDGFAIVYDMYQ